jgi:hypothetical protein
MKAIKYLSLLSLILIFSGVNKVYSDNVTNDRPQMTTSTNIKYEVNVYLFVRMDLCNTYWVQVTDETGRLVAPAKIFVPGIQRYVFSENGPAQGKIRVAMLVTAKNVDLYACPVNLGARPDVKLGPFLKGQTYPFVLRPFLTAPLDKN